MSHIVDDDPPIKTHAASKEYRDNWDRVFADTPEDETPTPPFDEETALECTACTMCGRVDTVGCTAGALCPIKK